MKWLLERIKTKLQQWFIPPKPHRIPLKQLICRAENRFFAKTKLVPTCRFCNTPLQFRYSDIGGPYIRREDQAWKCTKCFSVSYFGLPLTEEEFKEELKLRGGDVLCFPTRRESERTEETKARLRALGYIDFKDD